MSRSKLARKITALSLFSTCLLFAAPLATAQTLNDSGLQLTEVVSGLVFPTTMAFIGTNDILVLQKNDGRVRRVINGVLQAGSVLDVAVDSDSERGLLSIALHPNFAANNFVYLYYTESNAGVDTAGAPLANRVYRYTWNGSALVSPVLILDLPVTPGPNHDGGIVIFGPDGKLYIVIGDLNRNGQLQNNPGGAAPDDTSVILRLNDDGTTPADNPFFAQGGNLARYFAYGIRNSFGMTFDPLTNKLWITENGPANWDEINLVEPGFNSGWNRIVGPLIDNPGQVPFVIPGSQYRDPKFSWFNTVGPTGIVFLNSAQLGFQYQNDVFVGDINNGRIYRFKPNAARDGFTFQSPGLADLVADNAGELAELIFGSSFVSANGGISNLTLGPDGRLYVLSFGLGKIFTIARRSTVDCGVTSLQAAINNAIPGDTISVSGTCPENLIIANDKQRISLNGGGVAVLSGSSPSSPALDVRGKGVTVQGFEIVGGSDGIVVNRGANAVINNNNIHNTGGSGVMVDELAISIITNNAIENNPGAGIWVSESSTARIGFNADTETAASPNAIQSNAVGVIVSKGSSARIIGNTISSNSGDGVFVARDSDADIAGNTISANTGNAIEVSENSFVQLGEDAGSTIYDQANAGSGNTGFGIVCSLGGIVDGKGGPLSGATAFDTSCINDLLP